MSLRGRKGGSSSSSRGNTPNGRKRKLSSRSQNSNSLFNSSSNNSRTLQSYAVRNQEKYPTSPSKRGRYSPLEGSSSRYCDQPSTSASTEEYCSPSASSHAPLGLESEMAQMPNLGHSPFGNNFKGGGINNHKRPGQAKKIVIKNRKG